MANKTPVDDLKAKIAAEQPAVNHDSQAVEEDLATEVAQMPAQRPKTSNEQALEAAATQSAELLNRITDKAMLELTKLEEDIKALKAAIRDSHDHSVRGFNDHATLAVDVVAAKMVIADSVEKVRQGFIARTRTPGDDS